MARREYFHSPQCAHDGCTERAHYVFSTRASQRAEMESLRHRGGWRCARHRLPDEVLSVKEPVRETVLVSCEQFYEDPRRDVRRSIGLYWAPEGSEKGGSGFVYGPGFRAFAKDFPAGTRLIVTARVVPYPGGER